MSNNAEIIKVGIADLNVVRGPNTIKTSGLGSCVGVVIFDSQSNIAGLAHVMLPDSKLSRQKISNPYKYADTAIDILISKLVELGAKTYMLKAKIAGGAQMFNFNSKSDMMRIGPRNVEAVITSLNQHKIPLIASDVGGDCGRTIEFNADTSELFIRTVSKGESII